MIRIPSPAADPHIDRMGTLRSVLRKPARIIGREAEWHGLAGFAAGSGARLGMVSGRPRQGKTFLLEALARATGGLYLGATPATEAESLRLLADELAQYADTPAPRLGSWTDAVRHLVATAERTGRPVVVDDVAHLIKFAPDLPAILSQALDRAGTDVALILCGSAPAVMAELRSGPLRDRVGLELVVAPLDHRAAARLWDVEDPHLAIQVHAVVGGTTAYRRLACGDVPTGTHDFDGWVQRTVLEPVSPLFREARYLMESADVRDPALYHSILAAVATGNDGRGGIADYIGRRAADIGHHLNVLEDCGLLRREPDVFRAGRTTYHVAEPLLAFHHVVMRPRWGLLESGRAPEVWKDAQPRFVAQVLAPHFAQLCREHALGLLGGQVGTGVVTDGRRSRTDVDVAVFAPAVPGSAPRILALGVARWDEVLGRPHVEQLRRARDVLAARGFDVGDVRILGYSAAGFTPELTASDEIVTLGPAELYS